MTDDHKLLEIPEGESEIEIKFPFSGTPFEGWSKNDFKKSRR